MALPDPIPLFGANQAALNPGSLKQGCVSLDLSLVLAKKG
jgi:hypothetical protein